MVINVINNFQNKIERFGFFVALKNSEKLKTSAKKGIETMKVKIIFFSIPEILFNGKYKRTTNNIIQIMSIVKICFFTANTKKFIKF